MVNFKNKVTLDRNIKQYYIFGQKVTNLKIGTVVEEESKATVRNGYIGVERVKTTIIEPGLDSEVHVYKRKK